MAFTSPRFGLFLLGLWLLLRWLPERGRKLALGLGSCFFYAFWDWQCFLLLLAISVADYLLALRIEANLRTRRAWFLLSVAGNLSILGYFKYYGFFQQNLGLVGLDLPAREIFQPAGISFFTFKSISYITDVYRRQLPACRSWLDYLTYITFFPELIAGPIVRASQFLPQLAGPMRPDGKNLRVGLSIFVQGLYKKVFIADRIAAWIEPVFAAPEWFSTSTLWAALLGYAVQIYCDFSGYTDMAVGSARMLGFDLPANFRMPYLSRSLSEFWRRWHITLSLWLRDYVYIPLGGNRGYRERNLLITMLLAGLWHGASWTFVLWGGLHGLGLVCERAWQNRVPSWMGWLITQLWVVWLWTLFRCPGWNQCLSMWQGLLGQAGPLSIHSSWTPLILGMLLAGHALGCWLEKKNWTNLWLGLAVDSTPLSGTYLYVEKLTWTGSVLWWLAVLLLIFTAPTLSSPFIYFQF